MKSLPQWRERIRGYVERTMARKFGCRWTRIKLREPIISFCFDDFPRSALGEAGQILEQGGTRGTYYVSLGLMNSTAPTGEMFRAEDLTRLVERGHELGCHTYHHCHAWETPPDQFEASVLENRVHFNRLFPHLNVRTLSFPIGSPRPGTKRRVARHFECCRGGGQTFNRQQVDANLLSAFFLEQSRSDPQRVKDMIQQCCREKGWLILATHDVCDEPTPFGCTPAFFAAMFEFARSCGATILPVGEAWQRLAAQ